MTTVLVVDDEMAIRRALTLNLANRGYSVITAATGEEAMQSVASEHPQAVLLDLGLPGIDGLGVIHALRGWTTVPILVLTVRQDVKSKIAALDAGADDYITKPFNMGELLARLRAALRRSPDATPEVDMMETPTFRLDFTGHRAFRLHEDNEPQEVHLTPTEWSIVTYLVRNAGRLVTQRQLVTAVWGPTFDPDPTLLRVHMTHIRRKLERVSSRPDHFITDPGIGYRFDGAIE